jgi:hypothetical protein
MKDEEEEYTSFYFFFMLLLLVLQGFLIRRFILHPSAFILNVWEARPRSPLRLRAPHASAAARLPILVTQTV